MGINQKAVAKWVKSASKGRFYVIRRDDGGLTVSDGCAVVTVAAREAWDVIKALSLPLPNETGEYRLEFGNVEKLHNTPLTHVIAEELQSLTQSADDTSLTADMEKGKTARVVYTAAGYTLLDSGYFGLFDRLNTLRTSSRKHAPVGFFAPSGEFVGMVLPLMHDLTNPYIAPTPAYESAAD